MNKNDYFKGGVFFPKHQHLIIRAHSSSPIKDEEICKQFLIDLVHYIEMKPVTEPQAVNVRDKGNEGLTGSINLSTSHIALHCWEETGLLMLDVYSCTCFDVLDTVNFIKNKWSLDDVRWLVLDRDDLNIYDFRTVEVK